MSKQYEINTDALAELRALIEKLDTSKQPEQTQEILADARAQISILGRQARHALKPAKRKARRERKAQLARDISLEDPKIAEALRRMGYKV